MTRHHDAPRHEDWWQALCAIRAAEAPHDVRCTAPLHVVLESMRTTRRVRESRDALRRQRLEKRP